MNEQEFRNRFKRALGEPPQVDYPSRIEEITRRAPGRRNIGALGSIAATLALLMVAGLVAWRLTAQSTPERTTVQPTPTSQPTVARIDPGHCRLPVVINRESGPPGRLASEPGFVDTASGQYRIDAAASIADLPGGAFEGTDVKPARGAAPVWYDEVIGRWLPVGPGSIAPDSRSYVWIRLLPPGSNYANQKSSELHRVDLMTHTDHVLWDYPGQLMVVGWDTSGILVEGNPPPPTGGAISDWLIDPASGKATQQPPRNPFQGPTLLPGETRFNFQPGSLGQDAEGRTIYRLGSRQAGDQEWIFYEAAPGQRVTIYRGKQGDATGFDPARLASDSTGLWFSDYEMHGIWHWDAQTGLRKIPVSGLPALLQGANSSIYVDPAGPCM